MAENHQFLVNKKVKPQPKVVASVPTEPNIYDYATTEYAQDAFIAWMCANFNSTNQHKHNLACGFIKFLCDGTAPKYDEVKVNMQVSYIDVLVELYNSNAKDNPVRYIIIEDKKYSEDHDNQVRKYIDYLVNDKHVSIEKISVAYYKTGYIVESDSDFHGVKGSMVFDAVLSEMSRIKSVKSDYSGLASFAILSLEKIKDFFDANKSKVVSSGSEILKDYCQNIDKQYSAIITRDISVNDPLNQLWIKAFDEFVKLAHSSYPDLKFELNKFNGHYDEILITYCDGPFIKNKPCDWPVINLRSNCFASTPCLYFLSNNGKCPGKIQSLFASPLQKYKNQFSCYELPIGKFKDTSLNTYKVKDPVPVVFIKELLKAICDEYMDIVTTKKGPFAL